jgi:hypothetical protein
MTTTDLRYVDPASLSGEMQTRSILENIGTPSSVIDWVLDLVRDHHAETKALEKELAQVHLDMAE